MWYHNTEKKTKEPATKMTRTIHVGLIGDSNPQIKAHIAIPRALELAANDLRLSLEVDWLPTPTLERNTSETLAAYHALWSVPATPYASMDGALKGIQFAREHAIPFLGTCGGFQHAVIEYARNVLGLKDADHAESNPDASLAIIGPLTCSVSELTSTFTLLPGSRIAAIYGQETVVEQYGICNFGIDPRYQSLLEQGEIRITGVDANGQARVLELPSHPFFIATLYQPERSAFTNTTHPLVAALLQAVS
jgi:CTP synthase (UTP-ammonia lyase)